MRQQRGIAVAVAGDQAAELGEGRYRGEQRPALKMIFCYSKIHSSVDARFVSPRPPHFHTPYSDMHELLALLFSCTLIFFVCPQCTPLLREAILLRVLRVIVKVSFSLSLPDHQPSVRCNRPGLSAAASNPACEYALNFILASIVENSMWLSGFTLFLAFFYFFHVNL